MNIVTFADLEPGQRFKGPGRTLTETDHGLFMMLVGDWHPIHADEVYASQTSAGKRVMHGTFGVGLAMGMQAQLIHFVEPVVGALGLEFMDFCEAAFHWRNSACRGRDSRQTRHQQRRPRHRAAKDKPLGTKRLRDSARTRRCHVATLFTCLGWRVRMAGQPDWFSDSLARGLTVLRAFGRDAARLRISEVSERTGLTRAAARRFLFTLRELGYLGSEGDYFFLRPRVLDLGYAYLSAARIEVYVEPILKELADKTRTSAHFAVLDDDSTLFVAGIYDEKMHGFFIAVGARRPAYAGSLGKCLLSGLPSESLEAFLTRVERAKRTPTTIVDAGALKRELAEVRERGYAINNGEFISGVVGVGVPVRDRDGSIAAAININWFSPQPITTNEVERHLPSLLTAARQIEARLAVASIRPGFDTPGRL